MARVLRWAQYLDAASPAEVTLLEKTLASQPIRGKPERLMGDRGYDSNAVRRFLKTAAHSADYSRPLEQHPGDPSGWPLPVPLSAKMDRRADDRLARQLPPADRAL